MKALFVVGLLCVATGFVAIVGSVVYQTIAYGFEDDPLHFEAGFGALVVWLVLWTATSYKMLTRMFSPPEN